MSCTGLGSCTSLLTSVYIATGSRSLKSGLLLLSQTSTLLHIVLSGRLPILPTSIWVATHSLKSWWLALLSYLKA
ncbi:hypothetical protein MAR_010922 [Mya arenaria]|uniref:Uncharacterized protein n=1 Tax=Mya arenaria TaxID=6604 RepID=A0ABY7FSL6_MYAAR|nr:hypothetical protein MAR_010922 [Mya arenaria]